MVKTEVDEGIYNLLNNGFTRNFFGGYVRNGVEVIMPGPNFKKVDWFAWYFRPSSSHHVKLYSLEELNNQLSRM